MTSRSGKLIIVAGPSGTGKGTVENAVMEKFPEIQFSVSVTTRPQRSYEVEGQHYFFISKAEFLERIERNELVEWQEVYSKNGHFYGTLRSYVDSALEQGQQLLIDIDIKGGINLKKAFPDNSISIFIEPPSVEALEERLINRNTDSPEQIRIRLDRMPEEMQLGKQFDYTIVNSELNEAVSAFTEILEKEIYQQQRSI
ncbi:MAG: guanylate kinase [Candidatus Marinimicrobia bacterium]|jgi:guanylate kinase|nr:guanylate kinase [Candidatus Neomarinimicrobiota bacterium]MBT3825199.1 guanylate kinase [Candidatus Neomarinimicrobiota bacterium]MBT4132569.1 guanylate kinase [Candidatus Neomarinimicrobiota bacterium]MBT4296450.1 guanylate kinase [Candidatus Neomarinimicrobiota bacterium]MBT4419511.1 guanylate kinase [Candidatus Neomarinimicrobiota bacterium]